MFYFSGKGIIRGAIALLAPMVPTPMHTSVQHPLTDLHTLVSHASPYLCVATTAFCDFAIVASQR